MAIPASTLDCSYYMHDHKYSCDILDKHKGFVIQEKSSPGAKICRQYRDGPICQVSALMGPGRMATSAKEGRDSHRRNLCFWRGVG